MVIPHRIIQAALKHIEIDKEVSTKPQNIALCIDDKGQYRMYGENAWTPPYEPLLPWSPWSPPQWKPLAIITPDEIRVL